jgi:hypothetical protein
MTRPFLNCLAALVLDGEKQRKLVRIFDFLKHFEGIRR